MEKLTFDEKEKLGRVVFDIAEALGMILDLGEMEKYNEGDPWRYHGLLANKAGEKIHLTAHEYRAENRWTVHGVYPRDKRGQLNTSHILPEITVSMGKPSEKIVKDIEKRFLPFYRSQLADIRAGNESVDKYHAARLAPIKKIACFLGMPEPTDDEKIIYLDSEKWVVRKIEPHTNGVVKFEVVTSAEKAVQILEMLKKEEVKNE